MATLVTDDFNRANETPLASPWADAVLSGDQIRLVSNEAAAQTAGTDCGSIHTGVSSSLGDQWAEVEVRLVSGGGLDGGPIVRGNGAGDCYLAIYIGDYIISQFAGGVYSSLVATAGAAPVAGDLLRLEATGGATTTLVLKKNGVQVATITDSAAAFQTGRPGIFMYDGTIRLDNFKAGDFAPDSGLPWSVSRPWLDEVIDPRSALTNTELRRASAWF